MCINTKGIILSLYLLNGSTQYVEKRGTFVSARVVLCVYVYKYDISLNIFRAILWLFMD